MSEKQTIIIEDTDAFNFIFHHEPQEEKIKTEKTTHQRKKSIQCYKQNKDNDEISSFNYLFNIS